MNFKKLSQSVMVLALLACATVAVANAQDKKEKAKVEYDPAATRLACVNEQRGKIYVGDDVYFAYSISNKGLKDLPKQAFTVKLYCDGKVVGADTQTPPIKAGSGVSYGKLFGNPHFKPTKPGVYKIKLVITPKEGFDGNLKNNTIEKTITVLAKADKE